MRGLWQRRFVAAYHEFYGKIDDDSPIELASIRVLARQLATAPRIEPEVPAHPATAKRWRPVHYAQAGGFIDTAVYERDHLQPGQVVEGPAIIEERVSTTVIGPGDQLEVDRSGCLVITLAASGAVATRAAGQARAT